MAAANGNTSVHLTVGVDFRDQRTLAKLNGHQKGQVCEMQSSFNSTAHVVFTDNDQVMPMPCANKVPPCADISLTCAGISLAFHGRCDEPIFQRGPVSRKNPTWATVLFHVATVCCGNSPSACGDPTSTTTTDLPWTKQYILGPDSGSGPGSGSGSGSGSALPWDEQYVVGGQRGRRTGSGTARLRVR